MEKYGNKIRMIMYDLYENDQYIHHLFTHIQPDIVRRTGFLKNYFKNGIFKRYSVNQSQALFFDFF